VGRGDLPVTPGIASTDRNPKPGSLVTHAKMLRLELLKVNGHRLCLSLGRDDCGLVLSENHVAFAISFEDGGTGKSDTLSESSPSTRSRAG